MKKFNLSELLSKLQEDYREFDIADTVAIYYKGKTLPIKIDGVVKDELKRFRGSVCIYDEYEESKSADDYECDTELLVIEEYSDSPYSIYIDESGYVNADMYGDIHKIEVGDILVLEIADNLVTHYQIKEQLLMI